MTAITPSRAGGPPPAEIAAPRARFLWRALCLVLAPAAVLVCLELLALANLLDYRLVFVTPTYTPVRNPAYQLDPELIYIHRPNEHVTGIARGGITSKLFDVPARDRPYDIRYDRNGFRNDSSMAQADVAVIGDSFVEGIFVANADTLSVRLGRSLGRTVVNLGQIGYGPQQELVALRRYAVPLRPSVVVWAFFEGNDLKNAVEYDATMARWGRLARFLHTVRERSFTKNAALAAGRLVLAGRKRSALGRSCLFRSESGTPIRFYFLARADALSKSDLTGLERTRWALAEAHRLCSARGIDLVVAFIPTKFRVYRDFCPCAEGADCRSWVLNDLPGRFRAMVEGVSPDIGYVDLTQPMVEAAGRGSVVYFDDDEHWSPDGHRIAEETIAAAITGRAAARTKAPTTAR